MLPAEYDITGKTIIVTAGSRGIGKGIVRVLAEAGAKVMATGLTNTYLPGLAEELDAAGHPITTLVADATTSDGWQLTMDAALAEWGHIDVLVNTVGDAKRKPLVPTPDSGPDVQAMNDEEWRDLLDINLTECFLGCRAVGPQFLERRQGKVINISSFAARSGAPGMLAYSTAKAGITRLTQTLALEWAAYGVNVNAIAPGSFPDEDLSSKAQLEASRKRAEASVPLGRYGYIREVGLLALYLASDASNFMTGETLHLDGGVTHA